MKYLGKNTMSMLGIAALTMVASLAVMAPRLADAEDGQDVKTAETLAKVTTAIAMPKLEGDDCTVTLKMDKESYVEGDKPVMTVEFTNLTDAALTKKVDVSMVSRSVFEGGRMPAIARTVWTKQVEVTLAAGETKSMTVETEYAINAQNSFAFQMAKEGESVEADTLISRRNR